MLYLFFIPIALFAVLGGFFILWDETESGESVEDEFRVESITSLETPAEAVYTDAGFFPSSLTITRGQSVMFRNASSLPLQPASDPHPRHYAYPLRGSCSESAFDACRELAPGETWTFKFEVPGTWSYHNHAYPAHSGSLTVQ